MSKLLKDALRSARDMDEYLEVHSAQEIIDHVKELDSAESLRDQFAMQAVAGGLARTTLPEYDLRAMFGDRCGITREEILAADAYRIADAMLKARKP
jgi:hypothetical protein